VYAMMRVFGWSKLYIIANEFFQGIRNVSGGEGLDTTLREFYFNLLSLFTSLLFERVYETAALSGH